MRPDTTLQTNKKFKHVAVQTYGGCIYRQTRAPPTIIVSIQALEREAQLLLVILQVLRELMEVQTPVLVLIARGHDFLRTEKRILLARFCGISVTTQSHSAGIACKGGGGQVLKLQSRRHGTLMATEVVPVQRPGGTRPSL